MSTVTSPRCREPLQPSAAIDSDIFSGLNAAKPRARANLVNVRAKWANATSRFDVCELVAAIGEQSLAN
jgi:hypothetical protein